METTELMNKMTRYETLTLIISIAALAFSILIPLTQWLYRRFLIQPKLSYYPAGLATLFFNQSGSYMQVKGVLEAEKKAVTVKKIQVEVKREKDSRTLNLSWSQLISPVNQKVNWNFVQTMEAAHPVRVEANSILCAFAEFIDLNDSFGKTFSARASKLFSSISQLSTGNTYQQACSELKANSEYGEIKSLLETELFWIAGKYSLDVVIDYDKTQKKYCFEFVINEHEYESILQNVNEAIFAPLKQAFSIAWSFQNIQVELHERKAGKR